MRYKWFCIVLALVLLLGLCGGCAQPKTVTKESALTAQNDDTTIKEVEDLATQLAMAVMTYDLETIQKHSILDNATCESIHKDMLNYTAEGKIDWDGEICDTYEEFIRVYDANKERRYETINVQITETQLYDSTEVLTAADDIELFGRDALDPGDRAIYQAAVAELNIRRVAVVTFDVQYQDAATTDLNGDIQTYAMQEGVLAVYLVLVDGGWKSYSPTLAGVFPPLAHFPRYLKTVD